MKKLCIFAHDAGGSEVLLELTKSFFSVYEFHVFCTENSPCLHLYKHKNMQAHLHIIQNCKESIFRELNAIKPVAILYSTGWQNHIEYIFLEYAKEFKLLSVAFLDHWTNYKERFGYPQKNWQDNLPSYIAVHDETSQKIAIELGFTNIVLIKNYALLSQVQEIQTLNEPLTNTLLFLSEPTSKVAKTTFNDEHYWGFTEEDVFKEIKKYQHLFGCDILVIRLHPSDNSDVYKNIDPNSNISPNTLAYDIKTSKVIIGIDTIALRLAYLLNKPAIAFIPSNKRDFLVPLPKENQLRNFDDFNIDSIVLNQDNIQNLGMDFAVFLENILG